MLSPQEFLVYRQLTNPNPEAQTLAEIESYRGRGAKGPIKVDITAANLADGIGMPLSLFEQVHTGIKEKVAHHMTLQPHEQAHHSAVLALEKLFEVHIPRTAEPVVVRRIFTLKARADYKKIINGWTDPSTHIHLSYDQIVGMLHSVGAKAPTLDANQVSLTCYGILWESNNQVCRNCDLNRKCFEETSNVGFTGVSVSPKLLPATAKVRTAHKTDEGIKKIEPTPTTPVTSSLVEEELVNYMKSNFQGFSCFKNTYYTHKGTTNLGSGVSYLFWLGRILEGRRIPGNQQGGHIRLAFIGPRGGPPSPSIKAKMEKIAGSWYLPLDAKYRTLVELTEQHANERPPVYVSPRKKPQKDLCLKPASSI